MFRSFCDDYEVTCNQFRNLYNSKHFKNSLIQLFNKKKLLNNIKLFFIEYKRTSIKFCANQHLNYVKQVLNHNLYDGHWTYSVLIITWYSSVLLHFSIQVRDILHHQKWTINVIEINKPVAWAIAYIFIRWWLELFLSFLWSGETIFCIYRISGIQIFTYEYYEAMYIKIHLGNALYQITADAVWFDDEPKLVIAVSKLVI